MPIFQNSQSTDARGGTFNDVAHDQIFGDQVNIGQVINNPNIDLMALLQPVPDAVYDNINAVSGCLAGTRQEVIGHIMTWIDGNVDQPMCWLHGAAGSGKSAISKTIAEICAESNRLGASFFFVRGAERRSGITNFISTLAYHLAFSIPATRPHIESALQKDRHLTHRSLERQFRKLIIEPVQSVVMPSPSIVMVIDALDECDDKEMIADFINIVALACRYYRLPLRFLFSSRVEDHIWRRFSTSPALGTTYCLALQDFNADIDLRTFFRSRFSTIYEENHRLMRNISIPWPSESDLNRLVDKSSGSFIFAFTLANFVNDGSDLPHRKLEAALKSHAGLDPLYIQVLRTAPRSPHFLRIFETIMTVREHLSIVDLAYLLGIETGDVIHALRGVQSILIVPENDELSIRPFHASLRDFLTTKARSNDLYVNLTIRLLSIASDCLAVMVVHSGDDFSTHNGLKFACRSWGHHLLCAIQEKGGDSLLLSQYSTFMMKLIDFVHRSFDLWVNSLIVQELIDETLGTLDSVVSTLKEFDQCPPNMLLAFEKIRALAEFDEKSFRKDNNLARFANGYGYNYHAYAYNYHYAHIHTRGNNHYYGSNLADIIRTWRKSRPATTWSRFQDS